MTKDNKNQEKAAQEQPKNYNFKVDEPRLQKQWLDKGTYKFDPDDTDREIYSIDTPPPTVSGKMHIGHAFSYAQEDFVARFQRMLGKNVFYPFGTDDNGLPTDRLVERLNNVRSARMDRTEYIKLCMETIERIKPEFIEDWKILGMSCDWDIYYSTINDHSRKISQQSFIDLYNDGKEYQKEAPTMWCPRCQTAIAQVELVDKDINSKFVDIIFKVEEKEDEKVVGEEDLVIATTRPEMLSACVAVFAHPDDERYKKFFGKKARVPLYNHLVPIKPDPRADPEKGTGIVMCCTFGDQTDIEWYKAHNLPLKICITKDGHMSEIAERYKGLKIKEARAQVIEDLKEAELLIKEKPISHPVNVHERCGTEIEILNSKQWFIKYLEIKDEFIARGKEMNWFPPFMVHRFNNWIEGLQWDWCISRQRHFGVPFPVWYCEKCEAVKLAEPDQLPVDPLTDKPKGKCSNENCGHDKFRPEKDVLDTWATSSLTPMLAIELMKGKPCYDKLYPMSLRPQAHDIITFWLFNTVVKSHLHKNTVPWKNIMISGWALDPKGKKMSKSIGNVVEPRPVLEQYGADCLRFWAAGSKLGEDLPYQEKDLVTGKKMVNKLWNASKFALMHLQDYKLGHIEIENLEYMDQWLLCKLHKLIKSSTETFEKYEYSKAKQETEKFFWQKLCDNYLEIVKDRLYNPEQRGEDKRKSAQFTLYHTFLDVNKLFAPIMPHITDAVFELYWKDHENARLSKSNDKHKEIESIHNSLWPKYNEKLVNDLVEETGDKVVEIVGAVRKHKSEKGLSLKAEINVLTIECDEKTRKELEFTMGDLLAVCKADKIDFDGKGDIEVSEEIKLKIDMKPVEKKE
ncbi:valine--tRNA ligase [Candidatus Woesearchaeota archaeon]|jgi:valyl-tRNA synthetase|nr:valine--tRNA ligase [Candidatus Woesearchaeota archaeon]MBT6040344.1 valine--tRNA ligase [Candidatus Woesearchaeota archaeon]MBT6337022.1 valine--tRNA ligase [Candidatus Woesearchaeota archaeon]MBT7927924.1 valine--tRNA ligase [Candidatus Woesearchaeota archaeon]